jgi:predicted protein tyrosine phosphatase
MHQEYAQSPFPNTYWVENGKLLAGPSPFSSDRIVRKQQVSSLVEVGVATIIDLTMPSEQAAVRVPFERLQQRGVWVNVPLLNGGTPSAEWVQAVLDMIDSHNTRGRLVYVHCLGGLGRTGCVVGCWLVRHDQVTGEQAIDRLSQLRQAQPNAQSASPETAGQRKLVRSWRKGR